MSKQNTLRDRYLTEFLKTAQPHPKISTLPGVSYLIAPFTQHVICPQKQNFSPQSPPRGVLLFGEHGTGKTFLSHCVAAEMSVPILKTRMIEKDLKECFRRAELIKPCLLLVREVDRVDEEELVVDVLIELMDNFRDVFVIGTCTNLHSVNEKLKRYDYLENTINVRVPGSIERREIIERLFTDWSIFKDNIVHEAEEEADTISSDKNNIAVNDSSKTANNTPTVNNETVVNTKTTSTNNTTVNEPTVFNNSVINTKTTTTTTNLTKNIINKSTVVDFVTKNTPGFLPHELQKLVRLSVSKSKFMGVGVDLKILRESIDEIKMRVPEVTFDDIGALDEVKEVLLANVIHPLVNPRLYEKYGISKPGGVLLHGPPGSGKTLLAKAVSGMGLCNFLSVRGPELISKYVGDSEKELRSLFSKAKSLSPCVVFFDEIDSICSKRSGGFGTRIVNQILTLMDGMGKRGEVYVIAATNRIDTLDVALLRPGRFDCIVNVPWPDKNGAVEIFKKISRNVPIEEFEIAELDLEGFSGAEIANVVRDSGIYAIGRNGEGFGLVKREDVERAILKNRKEIVEKRGIRK